MELFFGSTELAPLTTHHSPLPASHSPLPASHWLPITGRSPLTTRHSPLATHHTPLTTRHSGRLPFGVEDGLAAAQPGTSDLEVVEGNDPVGKDLIMAASFSGDEHGVTGPGVGECRFDGDLAVGLDANLAGAMKASQQIIENLVGRFGGAGC